MDITALMINSKNSKTYYLKGSIAVICLLIFSYSIISSLTTAVLTDDGPFTPLNGSCTLTIDTCSKKSYPISIGNDIIAPPVYLYKTMAKPGYLETIEPLSYIINYPEVPTRPPLYSS